MKKIFTIIAAMLLSVTALQAEITYFHFSLSNTSAYGEATVNGGTITHANQWHGAQLWETKSGALAYDQIVLEVADHAQAVLFRVKYQGVETPVEKQLKVGLNSMAIDVTNDVIEAIYVLNWSEVNDVDITINDIYLRGATGEIKSDKLWEGSEHYTAYRVWDAEVKLADNAFINAHLGDILEINYTLDVDYNQIQLYTSNPQYFPTFLTPLNQWNQYDISKTYESTQLRLTILSQTDLTNLQNSGALRINGINFTLTSVYLYRHDQGGTVAIDEVSQSQRQCQKLIKNGQLFIIRDDKTYTIQGQRVH